jgi:hypothetical protein
MRAVAGKRRTNVAKFYVRPSRYGLATLKVPKLGFRTTSLYRTVRAP